MTGNILERITNKSFEDFPPATLYLSDLRHIVEILARACQRIEVSAGEYKITEATELQLLADKFPDGRFPDVKVQGYEPYLSIDFRPYGIRAYVSEDSVDQIGVIALARSTIMSRKKKRYSVLALAVLSGIGIAVSILLVMSQDRTKGPLLGILSVMLIPVAVRSEMRNNIVVHSKDPGDLQTFLQRKKDDLTLAAISAIFGAVVSHAIAKYIQ